MLGSPRPTCGGDGDGCKLPLGVWLMMGQQFTGFLWVGWTDTDVGSFPDPRQQLSTEPCDTGRSCVGTLQILDVFAMFLSVAVQWENAVILDCASSNSLSSQSNYFTFTCIAFELIVNGRLAAALFQGSRGQWRFFSNLIDLDMYWY